MAEKRVHCVVVESGSGDAGPLWGVVSGLDLVAAASVRGSTSRRRRLRREPGGDDLRAARRWSAPRS